MGRITPGNGRIGLYARREKLTENATCTEPGDVLASANILIILTRQMSPIRPIYPPNRPKLYESFYSVHPYYSPSQN